VSRNARVHNARAYEVRFAPAALKQLRSLGRGAQTRILLATSLLSTTPRPPTARALSGKHGYLRIRVGDYRVIYLVQDRELIVLVVTIGHRGDVYRR